jgi:hypothetical protein
MSPKAAGTGNIIMDALDMTDVEDMAFGGETEYTVVLFHGPEALTAVYDFMKVKVIFDKNMHEVLFS